MTDVTPMSFWWIETFRVKPGQFYRFHVAGTNDHAPEGDINRRFNWRVPSIAGRGRYAFRLRVVQAND